MEEKRVFGMTFDDVREISRSVLEWTDYEAPQESKTDFAIAFRRGAESLKQDEEWQRVFRSF